MLFGMSDEQTIELIAIAISFTIGLAIGAIGVLIATTKEIKSLNEEIDTFRDLYFNELDNWKNKYDQDDYDSY
jgi:hypothetical protein